MAASLGGPSGGRSPKDTRPATVSNVATTILATVIHAESSPAVNPRGMTLIGVILTVNTVATCFYVARGLDQVRKSEYGRRGAHRQRVRLQYRRLRRFGQ
jgi:hypothetical protein